MSIPGKCLGPAVYSALLGFVQLVCADTWTWQARSNVNAPTPRESPGAVWTGKQMFIWGGYDGDQIGGAYDPAIDQWNRFSSENAPAPRAYHTTIWTGRKLIVWGGFTHEGYVDTGGVYDPETDEWTETSIMNAPGARGDHLAVWTGTEMLIWGGRNSFRRYGDGAAYDPDSDTWRPISATNAPSGRYWFTGIWTGKEMIVWGGEPAANTGGRYDPAADIWLPTSQSNAPAGTVNSTSVWSGSEMLIWGDGVASRYNPANDSWLPMSPNGMPPNNRGYHCGVWTGEEMVVWGGQGDGLRNDGGRYNPSIDSWIATSTNAAPVPRHGAGAVWTGDSMIIFGGWQGDNVYVRNTQCYKPPGPFAGDGLPDDWQERHFGPTYTTDASPSGDPDHDQQKNRFEYYAGTDPTSAESAFRMRLEFEGLPALTFAPALTNRSYDILWTTNLNSAFSPLRGCMTSTNENQRTVVDTNPFPSKYYRLLISVP